MNFDRIVSLERVSLPLKILLSFIFSENYDHISLEERELLLSEIYTLLYPSPVHVSEEDLTKIKSPLDRQKYLAAVELAQSRSSPIHKSSSVLVLPTQYSSSKSSSNQSSPALKPRHKSESGTAGKLQISKLEVDLSDTKKRRTLPKITKVSSRQNVASDLATHGLLLIQQFFSHQIVKWTV